jgi:DNA-3-methyladenine glycosylase I
MKAAPCPWSLGHPLLQAYHDTEWGRPFGDDRIRHFEFLLLETMQAGLSWLTILKKREAFRAAFDGFDPDAVAGYGEAKVADLLADEGIIRNKLKIRAAIQNARSFLAIEREFGSFDAFIWSFAGGRQVDNKLARQEDMPVTSELSDSLSKALKARGFAFVGSTVVYSTLQAIGVVNDHLASCPAHDDCIARPRAPNGRRP